MEYLYKGKTEEYSDDSWFIWKVGNVPKRIFNFELVTNKYKHFSTDLYINKWPGIIIESYNPISKYDLSWFAEQWKKYLGDPIIPLNLNKRKTKVRLM